MIMINSLLLSCVSVYILFYIFILAVFTVVDMVHSYALSVTMSEAVKEKEDVSKPVRK